MESPAHHGQTSQCRPETCRSWMQQTKDLMEPAAGECAAGGSIAANEPWVGLQWWHADLHEKRNSIAVRDTWTVTPDGRITGGGTQSTDPRNPTIVPPPHVVSALNRSCDCDASPPRTWLLELSHWIHPTQDIHHNPAAASICNYFSRLARLTASPALASGRETHCE